MGQGRRRRWRGKCMAIGATLYAASIGAAVAQTSDPSGLDGPTWQLIATGTIGVLLMMVAAYARGLDGRVRAAEENIRSLRDTLFREHFTKGEVKDQLADIKQSLASLHRRLDYMHVPHSRASFQDDGA